MGEQLTGLTDGFHDGLYDMGPVSVAPVFFELVVSILPSASTILLCLNYCKVRCMIYFKAILIPFS